MAKAAVDETRAIRTGSGGRCCWDGGWEDVFTVNAYWRRRNGVGSSRRCRSAQTVHGRQLG